MSRDLDSNDVSGPLDQLQLDSSERAEAEWLLARDQDPSASPPSPQIAREYEELEQLLGTLPEPGSDPSWHDEVLKKAKAGTPNIVEKKRKPSEDSFVNRAWWQRPALGWTTGGLAVAAAALIVLRVSATSRAPAEQAASLRVASITSGGVRDDEGITTGFNIDSPAGDLRIFRKGVEGADELVKRCKDAGSCEQKGNRFFFTFMCEKSGDYYVAVGIGGDEVPETASAREFVSKVKESGGDSRLEPPLKCD